ncbi:MAG: radical SAM protein [Candidatus Aminicenantes bacterium]|nr:radical SAM protein [Candidatus Aminicenantes bacterium]
MITKYNSFRKFRELNGKAKRLLRSRINLLPSMIGDGSFSFSPYVIKFYINEVCNASCIFCDIGTGDKESVFFRQTKKQGSNTLSPDNFEKIINEVKNLQPEIDIHGLEPLLHKDIDRILHIIKSAGLRIHLVTNGILLKNYAEVLIKNRVDKITISLDGTREIHNKVRGDGIFEKAIEGLKHLKEYRSGIGENVTEITTNFTINHLNFFNISEYADLMLKKIKVDAIRFSHPYFVTEDASIRHNVNHPEVGQSSPVNIRKLNLEKIDTGILWDQLELVYKKFNPFNVSFNAVFKDITSLEKYYLSPYNSVSNMRCSIPWKTSTILANGDVIISNRCFLYKTGNIHDNSFRKIWRGEKYKNFRRELKQNKSFPPCARCCGTLPRLGKI